MCEFECVCRACVVRVSYARSVRPKGCVCGLSRCFHVDFVFHFHVFGISRIFIILPPHHTRWVLPYLRPIGKFLLCTCSSVTRFRLSSIHPDIADFTLLSPVLFPPTHPSSFDVFSRSSTTKPTKKRYNFPNHTYEKKKNAREGRLLRDSNRRTRRCFSFPPGRPSPCPYSG